MIQSDAINTWKVRFTPLNLKDWKIVLDSEYKRKLLVKYSLQRSSKTNNSFIDECKTNISPCFQQMVYFPFAIDFEVETLNFKLKKWVFKVILQFGVVFGFAFYLEKVWSFVRGSRQNKKRLVWPILWDVKIFKEQILIMAKQISDKFSKTTFKINVQMLAKYFV